MSKTVMIAGLDRSNCAVAQSIKIHSDANNRSSTASFTYFNRDGLDDPLPDDEIIIESAGTRFFGGFVLSVSPTRIGNTAGQKVISCVDYTRALDRLLVNQSYANAFDGDIIKNIVANYCKADGFTTNHVQNIFQVSDIRFNYKSASECMAKLAKQSGANWYVDFFKDVHFFLTEVNTAPFNIDDTTADSRDIKMTISNDRLKNRIYVRGGTKVLTAYTESQKADGVRTNFLISNKPTTLDTFTMTVGGVSQTVGNYNDPNPSNFQWLVNIDQKYVIASTASTPSNGTTIVFTYDYEAPIIAAVEDSASIAQFGAFEFLVIDKNIKSVQAARDRASAELSYYATTLANGTFITNIDGFQGGQVMTINLTALDVNNQFLVESVEATSIGDETWEYTVSVTARIKPGIIQFLADLVNQISDTADISNNEIVDQLFTVPTDTFTTSDSVPTLTSRTLSTSPYVWDTMQWDLAAWS